MFERACREVCSFVESGLDRPTAADELADMALAHNWFGIGEENVRDRIVDHFTRIKARTNGHANGHAAEPAYVPPTLRAYAHTPFAQLPPRYWIHAGHYVRKHVVMTVAPGGFGKSSLLLCNAMEMVTGRGLIGPQPVERVRVLYWNSEEPEAAEIDRRIAALCTAHSVDPKTLEGELFVGQKILGDGHRFAITGRNGQIIKNERLIKFLTEFIGDNQIGCAILDPLVGFHRLQEADTGAMELMIKDIFYPITDATNSCLEGSHHTRKGNSTFGTEITVDDSRGAGAAANACRSVRVMNRMTREEAREAGVPPDARTLYLRVHRDKQNLAPPGKAKWIRLASVHLENDDHVQAAVAWEWPREQKTEIPDESKAYLQAAVMRREYRFDTRATHWIGGLVGEHLGFKANGKENDRPKLMQIVDDLIAENVLAIRRGFNKQRKEVEFITAGSWSHEDEYTLRQSVLFDDWRN